MIRWRILAIFPVALALTLTACTGGTNAPTTTPSRPSHSSTPPVTSSAPTSTPSATTQAVQHVVIIVDENKTASSIVGNPDAPYLNGLAHDFATATDYSGVSHPSLPNYLAMTSGTTAGITNDCNPPGGSCLDTGPNLAQSIDRSGRTWKMYAESIPSPCAVANTSLYAVKHNPFMYFPSVTRDRGYCDAHVVPYSQFGSDLATATSLPSFSFISPNLCNDMHDCSVATGDAWLASNVPRILSSPAFTQQRSLLVVTFDEGDSSNNVVSCIFAGSAARTGTASATPFTHYSLLRTIEQEWGLSPLTANDAAATPMTMLLR